MDSSRLYIRDLKIACIIGCNPDERIRTQTLVLNLVLELGSMKARQTDSLEDTIDYSVLSEILTHQAKQSSYFTLECLAQNLLQTCQNFDSNIRSIEMDLEKPQCLPNARSAGVRIHFTKRP
ncbi:MAG: dihydroneopterin aldolase [Myxococcaceae bacterium]|nr:dihydroneopterin aldolase [Myxococcaceae bacterium]MBH2005982.1 dihydroneopterin aldolase [Myxococcaceae bacterium]